MKIEFHPSIPSNPEEELWMFAGPLVLCFTFFFARCEEFQCNAPAECALECIRSHNYLLRKVTKVEDGLDAYNVSTAAVISNLVTLISLMEGTINSLETQLEEKNVLMDSLQTSVETLQSTVDVQAASISHLEEGVKWRTGGSLEERTFRMETGELFCYTMTDTKMTWHDLEQTCVDWGGHLVSIHSDEENAFVVALLYEFHGQYVDYYYDYWLGGSDASSEGNWVWTDGTEWDYSNWSSGQPDGYPHCEGGEDYLHFCSSDGLWNDLCLVYSGGTELRYGICKKICST